MRVIDILDKFRKGYVYFIRAGYFGPIKIGFTTNFKKRLIHLQTGCPEKIIVLVVLKTNQATELSYHQRYAKININGEWFHPTWELLKEINMLIEEEKDMIYYDSENPSWEPMNKKQMESLLRYKEIGND